MDIQIIEMLKSLIGVQFSEAERQRDEYRAVDDDKWYVWDHVEKFRTYFETALNHHQLKLEYLKKKREGDRMYLLVNEDIKEYFDNPDDVYKEDVEEQYEAHKKDLVKILYYFLYPSGEYDYRHACLEGCPDVA